MNMREVDFHYLFIYLFIVGVDYTMILAKNISNNTVSTASPVKCGDCSRCRAVMGSRQPKQEWNLSQMATIKKKASPQKLPVYIWAVVFIYEILD